MLNTTTKKKAVKQNGSSNEETGQVAKHHKESKAKAGNVIMPTKDESPDKSTLSKLETVQTKWPFGKERTLFEESSTDEENMELDNFSAGSFEMVYNKKIRDYVLNNISQQELWMKGRQEQELDCELYGLPLEPDVDDNTQDDVDDDSDYFDDNSG
jgi:hypothetical protein